VLYFQGKEKGLVTNRTNADRIAYLYGSNTDGWIGKEIVLYTDMVPFQSKVIEAIRVKPPARRDTNGNGAAATTSHVAADRGNYEVMEQRKPAQVQTSNEMPDDQVPF
jgi:hypothetical protein